MTKKRVLPAIISTVLPAIISTVLCYRLGEVALEELAMEPLVSTHSPLVWVAAPAQQVSCDDVNTDSVYITSHKFTRHYTAGDLCYVGGSACQSLLVCVYLVARVSIP